MLSCVTHNLLYVGATAHHLSFYTTSSHIGGLLVCSILVRRLYQSEMIEPTFELPLRTSLSSHKMTILNFLFCAYILRHKSRALLCSFGECHHLVIILLQILILLLTPIHFRRFERTNIVVQMTSANGTPERWITVQVRNQESRGLQVHARSHSVSHCVLGDHKKF